MALEYRVILSLVLALGVVFCATPVAIRVAARLEFYDRPVGYKGHGRPTPYLGGAAVVLGFLAAVIALATDSARSVPLLVGVLALWAVGTIDDRRSLGPVERVVVEVVVATYLWAEGLGWDLGLPGGLDLLVTIAWIVAVVNAFNLFDNMDGAASTMALVVSAAIALLGVLEGDVWLAVTAASLAGACLGFLPHNLAPRGARIFLGDGGSMPVGFIAASLVMVAASDAVAEWQALLIGVLLVGVPALDTGLVIISRTRRGISILTGGQDHLTHRTRARLRTARAVAAALGCIQALLSAAAIVAIHGGSMWIAVVVAMYLAGAVTVIAALDAPVRTGAADAALPAGATEPLVPAPRLTAFVAVVLAPLALALGLSPLANGFYSSSVWAPAGLLVLALLVATAVALRNRPSRSAVAAVVGVSALATWSIVSAAWTDSVEQAVVEGNRLFVYAFVLALLVLLIRGPRGAAGALATAAVGGVVVAGGVLARLLGGDDGDFLGGRLDGPLGYINGQGGFFVMVAWILLGVATQRRSSALAGAGLGLATLCAGLAVLTQSRGALLAAGLSALVVLALVPGRVRSASALLLLAGALAPVLPAVLDVFRNGSDGTIAPADLERAGIQLAIAALVAGLLWGVAVAMEGRTAEAVHAQARRVVAAALLVVAVAGGAVVAASAGRIGDFVDRQYAAFTSLGASQAEAPSTRLVSGAGARYDYWRIAVDVWQEEPLRGVGAGGYDRPYFRARATTEDVRQPHSLPLQVLAELGLIGAAMLLLALGAVVSGVVLRVRAARRDRVERPLLVAAIGILAAWSVQASVDWTHLLPGVTGLALVAAAIVLRPGTPRRDDRRPVRGVRASAVRILPVLLFGVVFAFAGLALTRQVLAEHYRGGAQDVVASNPALAVERANRSLRLDREAVETYVTKSAALARLGDGAAAEAVLREGLRREPKNFVAWALLGDLRIRRGDRRDALRHYRRALSLNPRDPALQQLARSGDGA